MLQGSQKFGLEISVDKATYEDATKAELEFES
jgi:hypothetical protein